VVADDATTAAVRALESFSVDLDDGETLTLTSCFCIHELGNSRSISVPFDRVAQLMTNIRRVDRGEFEGCGGEWPQEDP
jgi:hypothetical protein